MSAQNIVAFFQGSLLARQSKIYKLFLLFCDWDWDWRLGIDNGSCIIERSRVAPGAQRPSPIWTDSRMDISG